MDAEDGITGLGLKKMELNTTWGAGAWEEILSP